MFISLQLSIKYKHIYQIRDHIDCMNRDMNIKNIPQDHKTIIYHFLSIRDLIQLGETCKVFYLDEERKRIFTNKLIDSCFYVETYSVLKSIKLRHFPDVSKLYFERLKNINIKDIGMLKSKSSYKGLDVIKEYKIHFDIITFLELDENDRYNIIMNLVNYLYDLWKYAEEKRQIIRGSSFDYLSIYLSIENIIKEIFIYDYMMREKIIDNLCELRNRTKDSKDIISSGFIHEFIETNRYSITSYFISCLNLKYWNDLEKIIQIADFLEKYNILYLYDFVDSIFSSFIDYLYEYSIVEDQYIDEFEYNLYQPYDNNITYKDRLFEIFRICFYHIHDDFDCSLKIRKERLYSMFIRNVYDD